MKFLFEISSNISIRNLEIVPRDSKFNHPTINGQILNKQNAYLAKHRNIAIVAIPVHAMHHPITDQNGKTRKTLKDVILSVEGVTHVHVCKRTHDLGKWNISMNEDSWEKVKTWLDGHLNKLYRNIPVAINNRYQEYPDFDKPECLHANRTAKRSTTASQDNYTTQLQKSILGTDIVAIPTRAFAPAWKATPRLVYTLDNMQAFPSLGKSSDDRSTGSLATTTSLTASADETIRQLEKQWKIDKDCFTTNLETSIDIKLADGHKNRTRTIIAAQDRQTSNERLHGVIRNTNHYHGYPPTRHPIWNHRHTSHHIHERRELSLCHRRKPQQSHGEIH
jgi:hypothetical protein